MPNLSELDQAIKDLEDFSNTSQLPWPDHVKQMMIRDDFPQLVKELRKAFENIKPQENVNAISRQPSFSIRGAISTTRRTSRS